ncbi:MAG: J domain-containing protein [Arcobacteraceae bacterium]|nr:J domain-containing protein [Arcobacteraceae bacterium]
MQEKREYLEVDFIIWNSNYGVRDFVTIGRVDDSKNAWLDDPYEMVGPFSLDELLETGQISFATCVVMSDKKWQEKQSSLRQESLKRQYKAQQQFQEEINRHNKSRRTYHTNLEQTSQKEHRELLCLPIEGVLEVSQIKAAYRLIVKKVHPDMGGTHEQFIKITQARDALLEN